MIFIITLVETLCVCMLNITLEYCGHDKNIPMLCCLDFLKLYVDGGVKEESRREKRVKKAVAALNILYIGLYKRRTEGGHRLVWSRTLAFHAKCEVSP